MTGEKNMEEKNPVTYTTEENRTVFDHIARLFTTFGVMVVIFILFAVCIGQSTREYSTLFELGNGGLTIRTLLQLLALAVIVTVSQTVFMTDLLIKNMKIMARNVIFISSIFLTIVAFVFAFGWFPVDDIRAWIGFILSFSVSMTLSLLITRFVEKTENRKMQDALERYNRGKQE